MLPPLRAGGGGQPGGGDAPQVDLLAEGLDALAQLQLLAEEDPEVVGTAPERSVMRPDASLREAEIAQVTHDVLAELPEIFRTVLVLREFEEQSYQAIADLLGISIGTVESRLFRARAKFKQKLLKLHPEFARGAEAGT